MKKNSIEYIITIILELAEDSKNNFVNCFLSKNKLANSTTLLEARIYSLFLVDYFLSSKANSTTLRKQLYEISNTLFIEEYKNKQSYKELDDIIFYRYNEYAQIPQISDNIGQLLQSLHSLYLIKIKNSVDNSTIEKLPPIPYEDGFEQLPKEMAFIEKEMGNIYSAVEKLNKIELV